jgi:hypothetical protein
MNSAFQPFDILIDEAVTDALCQCPQCSKVFAKLTQHIQAINNLSTEDKQLQNNLEGILNEDDEEEKHHSCDGGTLRAGGTQSAAVSCSMVEKLTSEEYLAEVMKRTMRQYQVS